MAPLAWGAADCLAAVTRRLAVPYPISGNDLVELQNTVYRVFNQSAIILPGSLLGNDSTLQVATQKAVGGYAAKNCSCSVLLTTLEKGLVI